MVNNFNVEIRNDRYAFLSWDEVVGATYYQIDRSSDSASTWTPIQNNNQITNTFLVDDTLSSDTEYIYRIRAFSTQFTDYTFSTSIRLGVNQRVGYTFDNYTVPENSWGVIGTPSDLRYTYLWGLILTSGSGEIFTDEQLSYYIESATAEFERYLDIDIRRRRYRSDVDNRSNENLIRSHEWNINPQYYTDEDDPYDFDPESWGHGYGSLQLRKRPIIEVTKAELRSEVDTRILDLLGLRWLRIEKGTGKLNFYPRQSSGEVIGPFVQGQLFFRQYYLFGYSQAFYIDYETGYRSSDFVPRELREVILKLAAIMALASTGDGILAGFSSSSISLDGLSESFSSTQSATSAYYGARIKQYQGEIKEWLKRNRYKYNNMPLAFI